MFGKDLMITKYPYLGSSPNLMEYFSIIGYDEITLSNAKENKSDKINIKPTILSSICSGQDYGIVDNDLIIRQIYPENPTFLTISQLGQKQSKPKPESVIYSFCFDSVNGKNKLFYVCFGFKFYEEYSFLYVPKAFCIVSQYPYFTLFQNICQDIYDFYNKNFDYNNGDHAPIEIVLYHLVNYIPSPLKNSLNYSIFEGNNLMTIHQLSGYPDFDFDAFQIFNLLSIDNIIKIFFITVIEQNILFFSVNSEKLSLTMFLFYALNYPCNDSTYFWHIISVSQCALEDPNNCENNIGKIVQKLMTSLLGVNCTYNDSIKMNESRKCCYIVDIDNKKLIKRISDAIEDRQDKKEFLETEKLIQYIDDILNERKKITSMFLAKIILKLNNELNDIYNREKNERYDKNDPNIGKFTTYFKINKKIKDTNKKIQMAFYDCYLSILMIFYQDNTLSTSNDKIVKDNDSDSDRKLYFLRNIENDDDEKNNNKMSDEEQLFCMQFKDSIKYKIYLENYIQDANCLDVYKIPLMFSEEFINVKIQYTKLNCDKKINYFSLIDKLYIENKAVTLGITLNSIHSEFSETFGKDYNNPKREERVILNKRLINKYINYVSNYELESSIYPYLSILESNKIINLINRRLISDLIEEELIRIEIINNNGLLFYSSIYIFSMLLFLNDQAKTMNYLDNIRNCFSTLQYFKRKYIYIILMTCYKYMLVHKKTNKYPNMAPSHIKMYFYLLVNYLRQSMIVPNEEMLILLQTFFKQDSELNVEGRDEFLDEEDFIDPSENNPNIFQMYMPYCFSRSGIIKEEIIVNYALEQKFNENILIPNENLQPKILIRLKGIEVISKMYSPSKIYKMSQEFFWIFFDSDNLDINMLDQEELKNIMVNLILYGMTISKIVEKKNNSKALFEIPYIFIINNLYQLLSERKNKKKEINILNK